MILQPWNYAGGKSFLIDWIYKNFPEGWKEMHYIDLFGGSGVVLLNKLKQKYETYNDINKLLVNFFWVVRNDAGSLQRVLQLSPYSRKEYEISLNHIKNILKNKVENYGIEEARMLLIILQQGRPHSLYQSQGSWRGQPDINRSHLSSITRNFQNKKNLIPKIAERLENVVLECLSWESMLKKYNKKDVFIFADPPYWGNRKKLYGKDEMMNTESHLSLAKGLLNFSGKVMLCGRKEKKHPYDLILPKWNKVMKKTKRNIGHRETIECLWSNYLPENLLPFQELEA